MQPVEKGVTDVVNRSLQFQTILLIARFVGFVLIPIRRYTGTNLEIAVGTIAGKTSCRVALCPICTTIALIVVKDLVMLCTRITCGICKLLLKVKKVFTREPDIANAVEVEGIGEIRKPKMMIPITVARRRFSAGSLWGLNRTRT